MPDFKNPFIFIPAIIIILLLLWNVFLSFWLFSLKKRIKQIFLGKKANDLEAVIASEIKRLKIAESSIERLFKRTDVLKEITNKSIKKVGIIRFNPFKGTGGDQSFSIALLDSHDNGIVLSALYTREGTRVYSKPILKGQSHYPLTSEEKEAIEKAESSKEKND